MSDLCTLPKAAAYFGVSRLTFSRWVREYKLPVVRINQRVLRFDLEKVRGVLEVRSNRIAGCQAAGDSPAAGAGQ